MKVIHLKGMHTLKKNKKTHNLKINYLIKRTTKTKTECGGEFHSLCTGERVRGDGDKTSVDQRKRKTELLPTAIWWQPTVTAPTQWSNVSRSKIECLQTKEREREGVRHLHHHPVSKRGPVSHCVCGWSWSGSKIATYVSTFFSCSLFMRSRDFDRGQDERLYKQIQFQSIAYRTTPSGSEVIHT